MLPTVRSRSYPACVDRCVGIRRRPGSWCAVPPHRRRSPPQMRDVLRRGITAGRHACQMVGTRPASAGLQPSSPAAARAAGTGRHDHCRPRHHRVRQPQLITWNIGTMASIESRFDNPTPVVDVAVAANAGRCCGGSRRRPSGHRWCPRCKEHGGRTLVDVAGPVGGGLSGDELVAGVHGDPTGAVNDSTGPLTTITCRTPGACATYADSIGATEASTRITLSSAWLRMNTACSGESRRLRVCSTAPSTDGGVDHLVFVVVPRRWPPGRRDRRRVRRGRAPAGRPAHRSRRRRCRGKPNPSTFGPALGERFSAVLDEGREERFPPCIVDWIMFRVSLAGCSPCGGQMGDDSPAACATRDWHA